MVVQDALFKLKAVKDDQQKVGSHLTVKEFIVLLERVEKALEFKHLFNAYAPVYEDAIELLYAKELSKEN